MKNKIFKLVVWHDESKTLYYTVEVNPKDESDWTVLRTDTSYGPAYAWYNRLLGAQKMGEFRVAYRDMPYEQPTYKGKDQYWHEHEATATADGILLMHRNWKWNDNVWVEHRDPESGQWKKW